MLFHGYTNSCLEQLVCQLHYSTKCREHLQQSGEEKQCEWCYNEIHKKQPRIRTSFLSGGGRGGERGKKEHIFSRIDKSENPWVSQKSTTCSHKFIINYFNLMYLWLTMRYHRNSVSTSRPKPIPKVYKKCSWIEQNSNDITVMAFNRNGWIELSALQWLLG